MVRPALAWTTLLAAGCLAMPPPPHYGVILLMIGFVAGWVASSSRTPSRSTRLPASVVGPEMGGRLAPQQGERKRPRRHPSEVAKQERWCRAVATAWATKGGDRTTKAAFDLNVDSYIKAGGDKAFQHDHAYLGSASVVIEIGGNKGVFAQQMVDRYRPGAVHVVEPVSPMVKRLRARFAKHPEVHIHQFALAKEHGEMRMAYRSDADAAAKVIPPGGKLDPGWEKATIETVPMLTFNEAWERMGLGMVDLVNVNIEGVEFDLVDALLQSGAQRRIRNLQVQFHTHAGVLVDDKVGKRCRFHRILRETHELVYDFGWVWEQWTLRVT